MKNKTEHRYSFVGYMKRTVILLLGLFIFAFGSYLGIVANIGLAPWEAFSMGISFVTGLSYGNVVVITGIAILALDVALKEKIGFGTILNTIMIGKFTDIFIAMDIVKTVENFWIGVFVMLLGQFVLCVGSYLYIKTALGCGPRDSLMVALAKRARRLPVGAVRGIIEGGVLLTGWALGAKVGVGTVIAAFGVGVILEFTFRIFSFSIKSVAHESVVDTVMHLNAAQKETV